MITGREHGATPSLIHPDYVIRNGVLSVRMLQKTDRGLRSVLFVGKNEAQLQLRSALLNGILRMRFPVAAKMALPIAGATGGKAGSPKPVVG